MPRTRAELRAEIKANCNREDKDDLINGWISDAVRRCSDQHLWRRMIRSQDVTVGVGDSSFPLPVGTKRVLSIRLVRGLLTYPIKIIPETQFHRLNPAAEFYVQGFPSVGYVQGLTVFYAPPSQSEWAMRLVTIDDFPNMNSDLVQLPFYEVESAVIAYATSKVFSSLQAYKDAEWWESKYGRDLGLAIRNDGIQPVEDVIMEGDITPLMNSAPWLDPFAGLA